MRKNSSSNPSTMILAVALILLGLLLILPRNYNRIISDSFENEPVKIEGLKTFTEEQKIPKRIIIPSLAINIEVERSRIVNGYWEVFTDKAGWGEGSGIPGEKGNQVIFAHAREGLFLPLQFIELGNKIYVLTDSDWFEYEVVEVKDVYPNETEVIASSEDEQLTLYTCSGYKDTKRLIVSAKRI